jgi:hypothetical protein
MWDFLADRQHWAIELAECYADDPSIKKAWETGRGELLPRPPLLTTADAITSWVLHDAPRPSARFTSGTVVAWVVSKRTSSAQPEKKSELRTTATQSERKTHASLLRDILGNPFRPVIFSPEWRTNTAIIIARTMYDARDFSAMPILADALQDTGCDNDDALNHCRDANQVHVRGCWVDLLEAATRGAVRFPRQVIALLTEAIHWRNGYVPGTWTDDQLDAHRASFDDRLLELVRRPRAVPEYATLAKHLRNHFEQRFAFAFDPRIEPTNWKAEQAIRPAVVNRKVWGGNRTVAGARAQGVLMSVFETCRRQARSVVDHVSRTLRWFDGRLLPRSPLFGRQGVTDD